jgi:hypothetical protein
MRRLLVRHRGAELSEVGLGGAELAEQPIDGPLLREDDVAQLGNLPFEMRVTDLQVHDSRFHGGGKATTRLAIERAPAARTAVRPAA